MSPNSIVKDYNLEFKLPSNSIGDMYAIQGMSVIDKIYSDDDRIQNLIGTQVLDFDNLKTIYLPDDGAYRAKDKFKKQVDGEFNIYNDIDNILSTDTTFLNSSKDDFYEDFDIISGDNQMYVDPDDDDSPEDNPVITKTEQTVDRVKESNTILEKLNYLVSTNITDYYTTTISEKSNEEKLDLLPYTLSMTIYGIGSIIPGDTFKVDYLPKKHLEKSFLQTMKVTHNINSDGWYTTLDTQYRPLFPSDKKVMNNNMPLPTGRVRLSPNALRELKFQPGPGIDWTSGALPEQLNWNDFFKYMTNVRIEEQPDDSKLDFIIHFKATEHFNKWIKNNKAKGSYYDNPQDSALLGLNARFFNFMSTGPDIVVKRYFVEKRPSGTLIGKTVSQEDILNTLNNLGYRYEEFIDMRRLVKETRERKSLDDTETDLTWINYGTRAFHISPANVNVRPLGNYVIFSVGTSAFILDPSAGNYDKVKQLYQKFGGSKITNDDLKKFEITISETED